MKIGILGGGQLGRMFLQEAANYPYQTKILDPQPDAPCAHLCDEFVVGDFKDADTVFEFGQDCDVIGIEIEHVSLAGVKRLEALGKKVIPSSKTLAIIQDKGVQKAFYAEHAIPSAPFYLIENKSELDVARIPLPFVQKTRTGGYDGKGVQVLKNEADLENLWDVPSVIEALCPIAKEIAAVVIVGEDGSQAIYPLVEMVFDPQLNLVDVVKMPAELSETVAAKATKIGKQVAQSFADAGIYAVELFVTQDDDVWVNETACRVHNSGHLTIEACPSSQFDQMWRVLAGMPLGATASHAVAGMVNLVGHDGMQGHATMAGLKDLLAEADVHVHWYGKSETRPGRKMGHVTVLADNDAALKAKIANVKAHLKVIVDEK